MTTSSTANNYSEIGTVIAKAITDHGFLQSFVRDPKNVLKNNGISVDDTAKISAHVQGNTAGGTLNVDVENANVDWVGGVHLALHKGAKPV